MRWLTRGALLLAALVALLLLALPHLIATEAVQTRVREAARDATDREVVWTRFGAGVFPPALVVEGAQLLSRVPGAPPVVEVERLELRIAVLPLLGGAVVVRSLVVEGPVVRLLRNEKGVDLADVRGPLPVELPSGEPPSEEAEQDDGGITLGVQRVAVRGGRVLMRDATLAPPVKHAVSGLELDARVRGLARSLDLEARAELAGGELTAVGSAERGGPLELELGLAGVAAELLAPYLGADVSVSGALAATASLAGRVPEEELAVRELGGDFALDLDALSARLGEGFRKPAGVPLRLDGRIVAADDGVVLEAMKLSLHELRADLAVAFEPVTRIDLSAPATSLEGWEPLLPAFEDTPMRGTVALDGLRIRLDPLRVRGRMVLDGVGPVEREKIQLGGALVGSGREVLGEGLELRIGGERMPLTLRLRDLDGKLRTDLTARLEGANSNQLLAALADRPDALSGPLDLDASLTTALAGSGDVLESMKGTLDFGVEPGRIHGVSLLRELLGVLASDAGDAACGERLAAYCGDEFEVLAGSLRIAKGRAHTEDLRAIYRGYRVDLRGSVGLAEQDLDLHGKLTMDADVDAALGERERGRRRVIPIAKLEGSIDSPKVRVTPEAIVAFAAYYATDDRRAGWEEEIDERLGAGSGAKVVDALQDLLQGLEEPPPE